MLDPSLDISFGCYIKDSNQLTWISPVLLMSKSNNYGLPESVGKNFLHEDGVPQLDCGNENHTSLPPHPPIILPDPRVRRLEKLKVTQALLAKRHEDGKSVWAHVMDMELHIDRLGMLGFDVSKELAVDLVLQSLPESYSEFIREYYMMDHDVAFIDLTYFLIAAESAMIWRTGRANFSGKSISQPSMGNGNIGSPEKFSLHKRKLESEIVRCTIPEESICFYYQEKGHWLRSCPDYLRDLRDGRVKMYDSASGSKKRKEA
ncbi:hypothetical protein Lser_V15G44118 [Lactuca serriola]